MCAECGCNDPADPTLLDLQNGESFTVKPMHSHDHGHDHHDHDHSHGHDHHHHDHSHSHSHDHSHGHTLRLEQDVLARNNRLAERNRGWLAGRDVLALNLVSSPGSGKTTLLERTLRDLAPELTFAVVEGDQATDRDARRIQATGCRVVQINTGAGCHLDAAMVAHGLERLDPPLHSVVLIENVGNLVCPALFDLGERAKVVVVSVTEGEDKPVKYPHMFRAGSVLLLNKIDLLPHVAFDVARFLDFVNQVNPRLKVFQISATRGDGLADWYAWLRGQRARPQDLTADFPRSPVS
jgi:hydrogenase nickel incorporation protein HypB